MAIEDLYGKVLALSIQTIRAQTALPGLVNNLTVGDRSQAANRGGTTEVIVPPEFVTRNVVPAAVPPASQAAPNPTTVQVPLDFWQEVNFPLTEKHITLLENADAAAPMFLQNAVGPIVEAITTSIVNTYPGIYGYVGTAGTTPFGASPAEAQQAKTVLTRQKCPRFMRQLVLNSGAYGNATGLQNFRLVDQSGSSETLREGEIGRAYGFDWHEDVGLDGISHTSTPLTAGAATINGAHPAGSTVISVNKATNASPLVAGDIVTFAGGTQTHTVVSSVNLAVGNTNVTISPGLRVARVGGEAMTLRASHSINLAFHPMAFAFDSRPAARLNIPGVTNNFMTWVDDMTGVALRLEIRDEYHQTGFYLSCLWGRRLVDARLACRIAGMVGE
ncbi:hypothetical protein IQ265_13820 [Nodosilinea sp. LEGE 06152]|uniref:P22 phage major capsid protein family protein n=1 Tax=Nodosilinea sp. LEGE 06152 TaxID=2777966 RepID=UPI001881E5C2|nr:P22 phage major capsid protein family protein [Nodosilinea sp. LEGE 06152]MBE9157894.1 hypothetical protein [Nodosilinea sp. LEGE 06152]